MILIQLQTAFKGRFGVFVSLQTEINITQLKLESGVGRLCQFGRFKQLQSILEIAFSGRYGGPQKAQCLRVPTNNGPKILNHLQLIVFEQLRFVFISDLCQWRSIFIGVFVVQFFQLLPHGFSFASQFCDVTELLSCGTSGDEPASFEIFDQRTQVFIASRGTQTVG